MAKSTPNFDHMIAARGGKGSASTSGKGGKLPPPPSNTPKPGGKPMGGKSYGKTNDC